MQIEDTILTDVKIFTPTLFYDERGSFHESFNQKHLTETFVQDNHSISKKNVLRGLHYQVTRPQGKLIRVVKGSILDVAVDIRKSSPTFKQWVSVVLSDKNFKQLWVPPGFAHGFLSLEDDTSVLYKTTDVWFKEHERSMLWCDPTISIEWGLEAPPICSNKDACAPKFNDIELFE